MLRAIYLDVRGIEPGSKHIHVLYTSLLIAYPISRRICRLELHWHLRAGRDFCEMSAYDVLAVVTNLIISDDDDGIHNYKQKHAKNCHLFTHRVLFYHREHSNILEHLIARLVCTSDALTIRSNVPMHRYRHLSGTRVHFVFSTHRFILQ